MRQITFDATDMKGLTVFTSDPAFTSMLVESLRVRGHRNVSDAVLDKDVSIEPCIAMYGKFAGESSERLFFVSEDHLGMEAAKAALEFTRPNFELRLEAMERA